LRNGVAIEAVVRRLGAERLGLAHLRREQLQAIAALAGGRDVLAVLPTGAGKSAIYELAGLLRRGPTIVVSPLIALEEDQLAHLRSAGLSATVLNSSLSRKSRATALTAIQTADEFVFISPEQLANLETREALRRVKPGLFVVDEAHLISQWGSDFRPEYLRLGAQADGLQAPVRLALTATAAPPVQREIVRRLGLNEPEIVIGDFNRPNIYLSVNEVITADQKQREIERAATEFSGPGIVYAATHDRAREARETLAAAGHKAGLYHAGLSVTERRDAMAAFLGGSVRIISATVAFGMGIDKPDIRWVLHADLPSSLDAYYQEIGRGGRDGNAAQARLLYRPTDVAVAGHLTAHGVAASSVAAVADRLAAISKTADPSELAADLRLGARATTLALARLADVGAASWSADGGIRWSGTVGVEAALQAASEETTREREVERSRVEMMRRYAEYRGCRRSFLLTYFGQNYRGPCGACDNDRRGDDAKRGVEPFAVGARVVSNYWGEGTVQRYDGDQLTVLFDDHGYRDLDLALVIERGLLHPVLPVQKSPQGFSPANG